MNVAYVLCADGVERFTNVKEAVQQQQVKNVCK